MLLDIGVVDTFGSADATSFLTDRTSKVYAPCLQPRGVASLLIVNDVASVHRGHFPRREEFPASAHVDQTAGPIVDVAMLGVSGPELQRNCGSGTTKLPWFSLLRWGTRSPGRVHSKQTQLFVFCSRSMRQICPECSVAPWRRAEGSSHELARQ